MKEVFFWAFFGAFISGFIGIFTTSYFHCSLIISCASCAMTGFFIPFIFFKWTETKHVIKDWAIICYKELPKKILKTIFLICELSYAIVVALCFFALQSFITGFIALINLTPLFLLMAWILPSLGTLSLFILSVLVILSGIIFAFMIIIHVPQGRPTIKEIVSVYKRNLDAPFWAFKGILFVIISLFRLLIMIGKTEGKLRITAAISSLIGGLSGLMLYYSNASLNLSFDAKMLIPVIMGAFIGGLLSLFICKLQKIASFKSGLIKIDEWFQNQSDGLVDWINKFEYL
jgi:hypothetical protein